MAGRASIVGAAATHVGKVREHNEDSHHFDSDNGLFLVCDGMGGHAAGEVASALAIRTIRDSWAHETTQHLITSWLDSGEPDARKRLLDRVRVGVTAAHAAILAEAATDEAKSGMGTTLVGVMIVGNEAVFAQVGDSRAYLVRDAIAMQLTEDHTLLARLLAAGIDVDVSGEGSRFRSMLTNALGIGQECKVATFVVPLADGDRFLLCSDGISEYVKEAEIGEVLTRQPSPARAAGRLIDLALERGGGDNATAIVVRVLEAGESPQPVEQRRHDDRVIESCPLWSEKVTPQQRLRALRIAIPRELATGDRLPAHTLGDRIAWIILEGTLDQGDTVIEPGALVYPESLVTAAPAPDRDSLARARTDVRALALRADDFRELCDEDSDLGEALLGALAPLITTRARRLAGRGATVVDPDAEIRARLAELETQPLVHERLVTQPDPDPELDELISARIDAMPVPSSLEQVAGRGSNPSISPPIQRGSLVASPLARPVVPALRQPPRDSRPVDPKAITIPQPKPRSTLPFISRPEKPRPRPPSEPEIEAYIELDAEPASDQERDAPPPPDMIVLSVDDEGGRVTETVTDNSSQTLTLTVTELADPVADDEDDATVTISYGDPADDPDDDEPSIEITHDPSEPRRPKRVSDGWDD